MTKNGARKTSRRRVLKGAVAAFNNRHSTIPCMVRDFSETGCRLSAEGSSNIPDTFELHVDLDGLIVDCRVVWRGSGDIGVKFTSPPKHVQPRRQQVIGAMVSPERPSLRRRPVGT